jgi:hypothetical protein
MMVVLIIHAGEYIWSIMNWRIEARTMCFLLLNAIDLRKYLKKVIVIVIAKKFA